MSEAGKARAKARVKSTLSRMGVKGDDAREVLLWARNRARALRDRSTILEAEGIVWPRAGAVEVAPIEVVAAGPESITVEIETSVVSPGTERANYLRLPNASVEYPFRPGYSAAGLVTDVGARVSEIRKGDRVAVVGAPHQSLVTSPVGSAFKIPESVSLEHAACIELGAIAGQGVDKAAIGDGAPFAVVGAGLIGLLAQRIAVGSGAGHATVIARTSRNRAMFTASGTRFIAADEDGGVPKGTGFPVVIEAAGTAAALDLALRVAEPGGRVVILGSDRELETPVNMERITDRELTLVGAHVRTVDLSGEGRRPAAERFLGLLASKALTLEDLEFEVVDPADAGVFYRRLAESSADMARFDWSGCRRTPPRRRVMSLPRVGRRGTEFAEPPAPADAPTAPDPMSNAHGHAGVAFVGCGEIALQNAEAVSLATNAQLICCFDTDRILSDDLARRHDAETAESLREVLGRGDVDLVVLAVPHHLHAPLATECLRAGKAVVVEKPPASDLAGAVAMVRAAQETGSPLSVCFPYRYARSALEAEELVRRGALGEVTGFQATWYQDKPPSYWLGGHSGRSSSTWRTSKELAGGGTLIMNASHYLDLVLHLCGSPVTSVTAMIAKERSSSEVEDHVVATLQLENGAVGSLTACGAARGARYEELRVWGSEGHVELAPTPRAYLLRRIDHRSMARWQALASDDVSFRARYFTHLVTDLTDGKPPAVGPEAILTTQTVMEAAYQSARLHREVCPSDLLAEWDIEL